MLKWSVMQKVCVQTTLYEVKSASVNIHLFFTSWHLLQVLQRSLCTLKTGPLKMKEQKNKLHRIIQNVTSPDLYFV